MALLNYKKTPFRKAYLYFIIVIVLLISIDLAFYYGSVKLSRLRNDGVIAEAIIIERKIDIWVRNSEDAHKVKYSFCAENQWYSGWATVPKAEWEKLAKIKVVYLPYNPKVNNAFDFTNSSYKPGIIIVTCGILFVIIGLIIYLRCEKNIMS